MKKLSLPIILYFVFFQCFTSQSQNLDEILKSHVEVMGYEKLAEIKTITIVGKRFFGERTVPFKTVIKRPNKYYSERSFRGRKTMQVCDGDKAWSLSPMSGVSHMYGKQLEMLKRNADFGGMLYQWKEKRLNITLDGREDFEGTELIKLKVESETGDVSEIFLDAESFITIKQVTKRTLQERNITATVIFSNYKMIEGVAVAFNTETTSDLPTEDGRKLGGGVKVINTIEFNSEVDDSLFTKPETKR